MKKAERVRNKMKNKEEYNEKLMDMLAKGEELAVRKETGKIYDCDNITCRECLFFNDTRNCVKARKEWLEAEYKELVDWSKVKIDTPILVRNGLTEQWFKRYFAKYENGCVYTFINGATSWSGDDITVWKYSKLADESRYTIF